MVNSGQAKVVIDVRTGHRRSAASTRRPPLYIQTSYVAARKDIAQKPAQRGAVKTVIVDGRHWQPFSVLLRVTMPMSTS